MNSIGHCIIVYNPSTCDYCLCCLLKFQAFLLLDAPKNLLTLMLVDILLEYNKNNALKCVTLAACTPAQNTENGMHQVCKTQVQKATLKLKLPVPGMDECIQLFSRRKVWPTSETRLYCYKKHYVKTCWRGVVTIVNYAI